MKRKESSARHMLILNGTVWLFAAAFSFTGCGSLTDYAKPNSNNSAQPRQAGTPAVSDQANTSASPAASAAPAGPAIATADGDLPGIRVEIQELKRTSGDTVTLKFAMINDSDKEFAFGVTFGEEGKSSYDYYSIGGVHMIDAAGKKKYFVVRDTEQQCLCSRNVKDIASKSRVPLWAKFPAPPGDVQKITLVIPHFIPMDDLPISQ